MLKLEQLKGQGVEKLLKRLSPGEYLFKAGDLGNTMFILISGRVSVLDTKEGQERQIGALASGDVIGEKALVAGQAYRRPLSLRAEEECICLEIESKNFKVVQAAIPDFTLRIVQMLVTRNDRTYQLATALRSMNPMERLANVLIYFCGDAYKSKKAAHGYELRIDLNDLSQTAALDRKLTEEIVQDFLHARVLAQGAEGYLLPDEQALQEFVKAHRTERRAAA